MPFQLIHEKIPTVPVLTCPDFEKECVLRIDASYNNRAVLSQNFDDAERVIYYLLKYLLHQKRNYSSTERECCSVIWAVEKLS